MRRLPGIIALGCAAVVLLAAAAFGVFFATFDPNDYKERFSAAAEKALGRKLVFYGDIEMRFFPSFGLKTGKLALMDAAAFGNEPFLTVESASLAAELKPLLDGLLDVRDISLRGVSLKLATNAAGAHNWEEGFGKESGGAKTPGASPQPPEPESGGPENVGVVPLEPPRGAQNDESGKTRLALHVARLHLAEASVVYRDLHNGASYALNIDSLQLDDLRPGADMPLVLEGGFKDGGGFAGRFSLQAGLRVSSGGDLDVDLRAFEAQAEHAAGPALSLSHTGKVRYEAAGKLLTLDGFSGVLSLGSGKDGERRSAYRGKMSLALPRKAGEPPTLNGELRLDGLDADALGSLAASEIAPAQGESPAGAPNLGKPSVVGGGKAAAPGAPGARKSAGEKTRPAPRLPNADLSLGVDSLTAGGLTLRQVNLRLRSQAGKASAPFGAQIFGGSLTGTLTGDFSGQTPGFTLSAKAGGLDMAALTARLSGAYSISGTLSASAELTGRGLSRQELLHSLAGEARAKAIGGEITGFALIPADLPNIAPVPERFPYRSLSASATLQQGTAVSRDILLDSPVITGRGGGTLYLAQAQADMGVDFMLGGLPPAVPVHIRGPLASPAYGVDMRTFLRNVAESAARQEESVIDLIRRPEKGAQFLRDLGENLLRR